MILRILERQSMTPTLTRDEKEKAVPALLGYRWGRFMCTRVGVLLRELARLCC